MAKTTMRLSVQHSKLNRLQSAQGQWQIDRARSEIMLFCQFAFQPMDEPEQQKELLLQMLCAGCTRLL
jgi:hypothetical protein